MLTPSSLLARQRFDTCCWLMVMAAPALAAGAVFCAKAGIVISAVAARALRASLFMAVSFLKSPGFTGRADTTAQPQLGSLVIGNLFFRAAKLRGATHKSGCKCSSSSLHRDGHGLPRRSAPRNGELPMPRHCERSEAIHGRPRAPTGMDCRVAPLLAMTSVAPLVIFTKSLCKWNERPSRMLLPRVQHRRMETCVILLWLP